MNVRHRHMTITLNRRTSVTVALAAVVILAAYLLGSSRPSVAAAAPNYSPVASSSTANIASAGATGITVTGSGKVTGIPDSLNISLSINTTAANINDALAAANRTAKAVQNSLSGNGVLAKDMQTSNMSIQPNYSTNGTPSGYQVYESLTATLRDLSTAGAALGAAVDAGGNSVRVDGVNVALSDDSSLMAAARADAISNARIKATQYATAAGRTVGAVQSISESVQSQNPVNYGVDLRAVAGASAASVPIQAGSTNVTVDVTVVFSLV